MAQLSSGWAEAFALSGKWKGWALDRLGAFQLFQDHLCMPWDVAYEAMKAALGRPIWTHEFADIESLREEWRRKR